MNIETGNTMNITRAVRGQRARLFPRLVTGFPMPIRGDHLYLIQSRVIPLVFIMTTNIVVKFQVNTPSGYRDITLYFVARKL